MSHHNNFLHGLILFFIVSESESPGPAVQLYDVRRGTRVVVRPGLQLRSVVAHTLLHTGHVADVAFQTSSSIKGAMADGGHLLEGGAAERVQAGEVVPVVVAAAPQQHPAPVSLACHACLGSVALAQALSPVVAPIIICAVAPWAWAVWFVAGLLVLGGLLVVGLLPGRRDATVRWLYAWVLGRWIGFRGISHVLAWLPPIGGLPRGWKTYAHTLWYLRKRRGSAHADVAALTIDDCPSEEPEHFEEVLRVLATHQVHATLFTITDRVERTPRLRQLLVRAVQEGHELGNHMPEDRGYHCDDAHTFGEELRRARTTIAAVAAEAGRPAAASRWFRAPKGRLSEAMMPVLAAEGYVHVLGDVHSNDHDFRFHTQYHIVSGHECIQPTRKAGQSRGLYGRGLRPVVGGHRLSSLPLPSIREHYRGARDVLHAALTMWQDYISRCTRAGSIVIVHCASGWLRDGAQVVEGAVSQVTTGGLRFVPVTELVEGQG
jgi:peptidoglycan/xylan/chitin deacetylase (PgdA/CDA1 family)